MTAATSTSGAGLRRSIELELQVAELCEAHARHEREHGREQLAREAEQLALEARRRAASLATVGS